MVYPGTLRNDQRSNSRSDGVQRLGARSSLRRAGASRPPTTPPRSTAPKPSKPSASAGSAASRACLNEVSSRWLKAAPPEAKKAVGERFKTLKELVEGLLDQALGAGPSDAALAAEAIDITLPGTRRLIGAEHPITRTLNEITAFSRRWATPSASAPKSKPTSTTSSA